jgi:sulfate transport system permease protein
MTAKAIQAVEGLRGAASQPDWGAWGLRLTAIIYLGAMIGIPTAVVLIKGFEAGIGAFVESLLSPMALAAIRLTLTTAIIMTIINTVMGVLTAYMLVRYRFPGKAFFNAFIDLPIAIPTLVTGVMLVVLYGPQTAIGAFIEAQTEQRIIFEPPGIVLALLFVSYPFVIRAVQPVLLNLSVNQEEAAQTLGASDWQTFWRVIFPAIRPAVISGALLAFARALGEFGSIIIVAGNVPMRSQTATVYVYAQIEAGDMSAATGISAVLIVIAFAITTIVDILQAKERARARG